MDTPHELECKLRITSREAVASKLSSLGAEDHGDALEQNRIFDLPDHTLKSEQRLLRLRSSDGLHTLACKGPILEGHYRNREEIETRIADADALALILERLGYVQTCFYEKRRHVWHLYDSEVVLDVLPEIGSFIEVEGPDEEAIDAVLAALDLRREDHIRESYLGLFTEHCESTNSELREMRF